MIDTKLTAIRLAKKYNGNILDPHRHKGVVRWDWSGTKPGEKMGNGILKTGVFKKMNEKEILDGMAEIYHYTCHKCGQGNLSRDEIHATKSGYICLRCLEKDCLTETLDTVSSGIDRR